MQLRAHAGETSRGHKISAYVGSWARGKRQTLAFNPGRGGEGEVTLMKLVAYENGVMPFGSGVTSDFINLFFFFLFHGPCENGFNFAAEFLFLPRLFVLAESLCVRISFEPSFGYRGSL